MGGAESICLGDHYGRLCKAKDTRMDNYLECLECDPWKCKFAISFGYVYLCDNPLRVYISKNFKT